MGQPHVTAIIMACVYLIALANCITVLTNERTTSGAAIAWVLLHLLLPIIAIPIFWLIGDFRMTGYMRRHRASSQELGTTLEFIASEPPPLQVPDPIHSSYSDFNKIFNNLGPIYTAQRGSAKLLVDGKSTFKEIFSAIDGARNYILVQYYIVRHDRLGLELKRLLIDKARCGIPVYFLHDDMGSFWLAQNYLRDLKESGVKVARFLPVASFKRFFQANFRNHRKLVVVDGRLAFTGGLNVGDEYVAPRSKKSRRYWRDTHLVISGPPVRHLEEVFLEDWFFATDHRIELPVPLQNLQQPPTNIASLDGTAKNVPIRVVPTGPSDETVVSMMLVLNLINSAQKSLWIATPYFVPDQAIVYALQLAVLRGVEVRLMLPKRGDHRLVQWASISFAQKAQKAGVQVLLYVAGFMHQKVILVDRSVAAIGTMNLDNRAIFLNFETMILVHDEGFCDFVNMMLENDFLSCRFLKEDAFSLTRSLKKMRGNATKIVAPLL